MDTESLDLQAPEQLHRRRTRTLGTHTAPQPLPPSVLERGTMQRPKNLPREDSKKILSVPPGKRRLVSLASDILHNYSPLKCTK